MSRGIIQLLCIVVVVVVVVVVDVEPWANPSEGMVLELIDSPTPATPRQGENSFSTTKPEHFCRKLKSHSCTHSRVQISLAPLVWSFSYFM